MYDVCSIMNIEKVMPNVESVSWTNKIEPLYVHVINHTKRNEFIASFPASLRPSDKENGRHNFYLRYTK